MFRITSIIRSNNSMGILIRHQKINVQKKRNTESIDKNLNLKELIESMKKWDEMIVRKCHLRNNMLIASPIRNSSSSEPLFTH